MFRFIFLAFLIAITVSAQTVRQLNELATKEYKAKNYSKGIEYLMKIIPKEGNNYNLYYTIACYYALMGEKENAVKYLAKSADMGYRYAESTMKDSDLESLKAEEQWKDIIGKMGRNKEKYEKLVNKELKRLYDEDQTDRKSKLEWKEIVKRDSTRKTSVLNEIKENRLNVSEDYLNAAMILHHGSSLEDIQLAYKLSQRSFELNNGNVTAKWMLAGVFDRMQLKSHKPQWYGTQQILKDNVLYLDTIDSTKVSDEERYDYYCKTMAENRKYIVGYNKTDKYPLIVPDSIKSKK